MPTSRVPELLMQRFASWLEPRPAARARASLLEVQLAYVDRSRRSG
jgi:hypothetical protein